MNLKKRIFFFLAVVWMVLGLTGCADKSDHNGDLSCTLSISCETLIGNDSLGEEKEKLVPEDGYLLEPETVPISEGESVFDVLYREVREKKIHMEYERVPAYDSIYIEGIGNLYEFDGGPKSGWMYRVNGEFPNYGCSSVEVQDGDVIEWVYTCDLGADVGSKRMSEEP